MKRSLVHLVTQYNQKLGAGVWALGISANTFPLDIYGRHRFEFFFLGNWLLTSDGASKFQGLGFLSFSLHAKRFRVYVMKCLVLA